MMSGLLSPKSLGLTDADEILKFIKLAKRLLKIIDFYITFVSPLFVGIIMMVPLVLNLSLSDILMYSCPNLITFVLFCFYSYEINLFQAIYFYLLCYYIRLKINAMNTSIIETLKSNMMPNINQIVHIFDSIYREINEYNTTFWSKYLLSFWLFMGSVIIFLICIVSFISMPLLYRLVWIYFIILLSAIFLFVIFTASSVNAKALKSYKILNQVMLKYNDLFRKSQIRNGKVDNVSTISRSGSTNRSLFIRRSVSLNRSLSITSRFSISNKIKVP